MSRGAIAVFGVLVGLVAPARADHARLRYAAPATCPSIDDVATAVERQLGYAPFADDAPISITVVIRAGGDVLTATIEVRDPAGATERSLSTARDDCEELARSIALSIAIALDPMAGLLIPQDEAMNMAELATATPARILAVDWDGGPPPLAPAVEAKRPHAPISVFVGAGIIAGTGLSPGATQGVVVTASGRRGAVSLGAELRLDRGGSTAVSGGLVTAQLAAASVFACAHAGRMGMCALGAAGGIRGAGDGLDEDRAGTAPYFGAGARLVFEHALADRVSARLHADLTRTLGSTSLEVNGMEVWGTAPWAASFGIAAVARFP